jgi:hypothetical protein
MLLRLRAAGSACSTLQRALSHASLMPLPQPAAAVAASMPATAACPMRTLFTRTALLAPREKKSRGGKEGEDTDAAADAPTIAPTLDSLAAAAAEPAPRERKPRVPKEPKEADSKAAPPPKSPNKKKLAMRSKTGGAAAASKGAAKLKKDGTLETRKDQMSVESVIEKEVPLMDLTGLTPGQNKVRMEGKCHFMSFCNFISFDALL